MTTEANGRAPQHIVLAIQNNTTKGQVSIKGPKSELVDQKLFRHPDVGSPYSSQTVIMIEQAQSLTSALWVHSRNVSIKDRHSALYVVTTSVTGSLATICHRLESEVPKSRLALQFLPILGA